MRTPAPTMMDAEAMQKAKEIFANFDKDADGVLNRVCTMPAFLEAVAPAPIAHTSYAPSLTAQKSACQYSCKRTPDTSSSLPVPACKYWVCVCIPFINFTWLEGNAVCLCCLADMHTGSLQDNQALYSPCLHVDV